MQLWHARRMQVAPSGEADTTRTTCVDSRATGPAARLFPSSATRALPLLMLSLLMLLLSAAPSPLFLMPAGATNSSAPSSCSCEAVVPPLPDVVRIAILVYANTTAGRMSDHPFKAVGPEPSQRFKGFITPEMQGLQLYTDSMLRRGNLLPLAGGTSLRLEFTYINQGFVDWDDSPDFGSRVLPTLVGPTGLWANVSSPDAALSAPYGGPFTFIVSSASTPDTYQPVLMNLCEDSASCMVISPFAANKAIWACASAPDPPEPDCVSRGRLPGQRRFLYALGVLSKYTDLPSLPLELYHTAGLKTIGVVGQGARAGQAFTSDYMSRLVVLARALAIESVFSEQMVVCASCPGERHYFPNGESTASVARRLVLANPDALFLVIGTASSGSYQTLVDLFRELRALDWIPKAMHFVGGGDGVLPFFFEGADLDFMSYATSAGLFDSRLKAPMYSNKLTATNFELFPATDDDDKDGPQVFAEAFTTAFGAFDFTSGGTGYLALGGYQALTIAQKLIEFARTAHVPSLQAASARISVPSAYLQLEFDIHGQERTIDPVILQLVPPTTPVAVSPGSKNLKPFALALVVPYNVGVQMVHPLPLWGERVYAPRFYASPREVLLLAVTALIMSLCCGLLFMLMRHWRHPVIAASTPIFCCLVVVGVLMMLGSNFFETLHVNDAHCQAQVWLLTCGFSLTFGALFIKTWRIYKLFSSKLLAAVLVPEKELLAATAVVLLIDVLINAVWQATAGMVAELIVVDPIRPAYNYMTCAYGPERLRFVYAHIAVKCSLLLCGVFLAWSVRRAPSLFSESTHISLAIYTVSLILAFVIPVLSAHLGGRQNTYLIRGFSICFVGVATSTVLFAPKLWKITRKKSKRHHPNQSVAQPVPNLPPQESQVVTRCTPGSSAAHNVVQPLETVLQSTVQKRGGPARLAQYNPLANRGGVVARVSPSTSELGDGRLEMVVALPRTSPTQPASALHDQSMSALLNSLLPQLNVAVPNSQLPLSAVVVANAAPPAAALAVYSHHPLSQMIGEGTLERECQSINEEVEFAPPLTLTPASIGPQA